MAIIQLHPVLPAPEQKKFIISFPYFIFSNTLTIHSNIVCNLLYCPYDISNCYWAEYISHSVSNPSEELFKACGCNFCNQCILASSLYVLNSRKRERNCPG